MRAHNALVLLVWSGLSCVVKAESEEYPLCYAGFCKDNNCVIQPHNVTWPCSELSPCEVEGTECFIDTYPYPDAPMNLGCGGSEAAKAFGKIRRQVDKKPRPEWWGLVHKYDEELSKYWKEREERELKEFDGLLSPFMEKRLRRSGNLPKGYDARKRRIQIEKEEREKKEREEEEAAERREREEKEKEKREEREKQDREEQERKTREEQERKTRVEQEKKEKVEQEKKGKGEQEKKKKMQEKKEMQEKETEEQEQKKTIQENEKEKKIQDSKQAEKKAREAKLRDVIEEAKKEGEQENSEL